MYTPNYLRLFFDLKELRFETVEGLFTAALSDSEADTLSPKDGAFYSYSEDVVLSEGWSWCYWASHRIHTCETSTSDLTEGESGGNNRVVYMGKHSALYIHEWTKQ
jgi:hypothetical protein